MPVFPTTSLGPSPTRISEFLAQYGFKRGTNILDLFTVILKSRTMKDAVIDKFNFMEETARNGNRYFEYENHKSEKNITFLEKVQRKIKINFRQMLVWWNCEK